MPLKAFLLCAGEGTRFHPHTQVLPKPLIPFLNLPLCAYNLYLLKILGVQNIVVNTHTHPALLKKNIRALAKQTGFTSPPTFSFEKTPLGGAGGLLKVKDFFKPSESFFYLNGDSFICLKAKEEILDFYSAHIESKALVSFLVWPASYTKSSPQFIKKAYIYAKGDRVCSFSTSPKDNKKVKPYEFSGLALFSSVIFKKIEQAQQKIIHSVITNKMLNSKQSLSTSLALHIFKDVLSPLVFKEYIRVHSIPTTNGLLTHPFNQQTKVKSLSQGFLPRGLDMNQLSTYLAGTELALHFLVKQRGAGFLQSILDFYTPDWRRYEGDNYFSAQLIKKPVLDGILFCGPGVRGLSRLSVKGFAVLGDRVFIKNPLCVQQSVLGKRVCLNTHLQNDLKL